MDRDTFIFIAFCLFVLLLGIRFKQRLSLRTADSVDEKNEKEENTLVFRQQRWRNYFFRIRLVLLIGLAIYMIIALTGDFTGSASIENREIFLRCLIFIFTIYIIIRDVRSLLRRNRGRKC